MHASEQRGPLGQQAASRRQGGCAVISSYVLTRPWPTHDHTSSRGVRWPPPCAPGRSLSSETIASALASESVDVGSNSIEGAGCLIGMAPGTRVPRQRGLDSEHGCAFNKGCRHGRVCGGETRGRQPHCRVTKARFRWWEAPCRCLAEADGRS